jgi:uncharacterized protein (TIGR02266 family)
MTTSKRKYRRRPIRVTLRMRDQSGAGEIEFDTHDISLGGAFVRSDLFFEIGEQFEVELHFPGQAGPLFLKARVVRASREEHKPGMGVAFEPMSDDVRNAINDFLNR